MPTVQREELSPAHEARLRALSEIPDEPVARRARLILRWHAGATQAEIAEEVGLSISGVAHWLREYRNRGLSIFDSVATQPVLVVPPAEPAVAATPAPEEAVPATVPEAAPASAIDLPVAEKPRRGRKPGVKRVPTAAPADQPEADQNPAVVPAPAIEAVPVPSAEAEAEPIVAETVAESAVSSAAPVEANEPEEDDRPALNNSPSTEPVIGLLSARSRPKAIGRPSAPPPPPPMLPDITEEVPPPKLQPDQSAGRSGQRQGDGRRGRPPGRSNERTNERPPQPPKAAPQSVSQAAPVAQPTIERKNDRPAVQLPMLPKVAPPPPMPVIEARPPAPITPAPVKPTEPKPTVRGLLEFYEADLAHAQQVAKLAGALFDATAETHRLHDRTRRVLEAGALLHNIAFSQDATHHATRGRDIVLATPLEGFNPEERRMIALLVAFHRDRVTPEREPSYLTLPAELRADTLALAAILRLADGGDDAQTQTTEIAEVLTEPDELAIGLHGPSAGADGLAILNRADLWERLFGQHVSVYLAEGADGNLPLSRSLAVPPALRDQMPDISLTLNPSLDAKNAYRQLALHYADRVDRLAARVRVGDQHKLAAFERELERLADVLDLAGLTRFNPTLGWLREKAHAARLTFTIVDRASALADEADQSAAGTIAAGLNHWRFALRAAFEALDFARCDHLIGELRRELLTEAHDQPGAGLVGRIGVIVWERLAVLREAVEQGESVHRALSATYRLQDALLYFRSVLGVEATQALDMLTPFENYLSAITIVQSSLDALDRERFPDGSPEAQAITAFRQAQTATLDELADNLPNLWNVVNSPVFRRTLALALAQA